MQAIKQILETTRGSVAIREAALSDVEGFRELRLHALQEAPTAFSADYDVNFNQPTSYWEGRLTFDEYRTIFFADFENKLIGMTGIGRRDSPKTRHSAEIYSVYVRPEWRGLHIAEALIEACIQWAKAREVIIVKLGVTSSSTSAVRCYQRCGFTIYGTEPRGIFYDGQYHDGYLMYRDIA
ncbi:MAG TPA: GNAT family N-acetyltransferase [Anaerolineales bacterium]|nr:GNAT family N-acetyltransferase [Anaerolineales bacterium]